MVAMNPSPKPCSIGASYTPSLVLGHIDCVAMKMIISLCVCVHSYGFHMHATNILKVHISQTNIDLKPTLHTIILHFWRLQTRDSGA